MTDWTPEKQWRVFAAAYTEARGVFPGRGGRFVDEFPHVVLATAKAQREDPEALFRRHLATWLKKMPHEAKRAPYAFFAQAWGELADKGPECLPEAPRKPVDPRAAREAAEARMAELKARLGLLEGEYAYAKSRGSLVQESAALGKLAEVKAEMRRVKGDL
jgi:hypothetical protein